MQLGGKAAHEADRALEKRQRCGWDGTSTFRFYVALSFPFRNLHNKMHDSIRDRDRIIRNLKSGLYFHYPNESDLLQPCQAEYGTRVEDTREGVKRGDRIRE